MNPMDELKEKLKAQLKKAAVELENAKDMAYGIWEESGGNLAFDAYVIYETLDVLQGTCNVPGGME